MDDKTLGVRLIVTSAVRLAHLPTAPVRFTSRTPLITARRTVSWDRGQMEAETLEKVECLKHWKRSGISNEV
jgi:hypothetical protein